MKNIEEVADDVKVFFLRGLKKKKDHKNGSENKKELSKYNLKG